MSAIPTSRRRVVHVGTGMTGSVALAAIIDDPALELIGVKVSTPTKVGVDAGQLCARPRRGCCRHGYRMDEYLAAFRRPRGPSGRVGAVLCDGDVDSVARNLAAPSASRRGRDGVLYRRVAHYDLRLDPTPGNPTNPGVAATAMAAVNAIPAVIDAPPGLLTAPLAGPAIVTRRTR